ncbi:hypothetical protein Scep_001319 [Stephania cephalantha]|uniref:Uncharacterized protein n=1 Tax=Stephania cephalantha TaxID=152367 RepID=A0AAP0L944_9MAGN
MIVRLQVRGLRALMSCIHRTTKKLQEILRLLRAHVTPSSSAALVGPAVVEETHVLAEIVLPTHETLHEEMLSALTDTGVE